MGKVKVKFFSHLRYATGMKETDMEIDDGEMLIKLIERLIQKFGSNFEDRIKDKETGTLAPFLIMVGQEEISSVNGDLNHRLSNGDVVSLLDPVGGG
ncbi:hypothetical protein A3K80_03925 [Candidatus Bathyarchaeota archaeon RBG_13_38_9]|nr:MAG: hypothetical protein A3K80_03925 [Candidatus Bathyarchaeota archaeon RBG_13_38_9]